MLQIIDQPGYLVCIFAGVEGFKVKKKPTEERALQRCDGWIAAGRLCWPFAHDHGPTVPIVPLNGPKNGRVVDGLQPARTNTGAGVEWAIETGQATTDLASWRGAIIAHGPIWAQGAWPWKR